MVKNLRLMNNMLDKFLVLCMSHKILHASASPLHPLKGLARTRDCDLGGMIENMLISKKNNGSKYGFAKVGVMGSRKVIVLMNYKWIG